MVSGWFSGATKRMALKWCLCVAMLLVLGTVAQRQNINLVIPQTMQRSPLEVDTVYLSSTRSEGAYKVFDRNLGTSWLVATKNDKFGLIYRFDRGTSIKKYKISVHPSLGKKLYPKSWILTGSGYTTTDIRSRFSVVLDEVTDATFTNGEFVGKVADQTAFSSFTLTFTKDNGTPGDGKLKIGLTEIALIGPKSQLNFPGFPGGAYPCAGSMELIKPPSGALESYFVSHLNWEPRTRGTWTQEFVRDLFALKKRNAHDSLDGQAIEFDARPRNLNVTLGCEFETPTKVLAFALRENESWGTWGFKLEGHKCESKKKCRRHGYDGWVTLFTRAPVYSDQWHISRPYIFPVEVPDYYKMYRIKMTPSVTNKLGVRKQNVENIHLFQCRE